MYSITDAARLVKLRPERVRRWLQGYEFAYSAGPGGKVRKKQKEPIIARGASDLKNYASFLDLIDLLFVREFINFGVPLQRLRKALYEAKDLIDDHHFAHRVFFTNGNRIYLQIKNNTNADALIELLSGGQWAIAPIIMQIAEKIDFDRVSGYARRWYPRGSRDVIVLDPRISFGKPIIIKRGIATETIYDMYLGEGEKVDPVCKWMDLRKKEVVAAVEFERWLAAA